MSDGDASILGRLGLRNELVTWLIARGHGDFVQMLPSEVEAYQRRQRPRCPRVTDEEACGQLMVARGLSWACYHHDPPERLRDESLRPLYADGRIEDHLGHIVEAEYTKEPHEKAASWKTKVRAF